MNKEKKSTVYQNQEEGMKKRKRSDSLEITKEKENKILKKRNETPKEEEEKIEYTDLEIEMRKRGLPIHFDTTKDKHVEKSDCYGYKIEKIRKWKQFMHKGKRKPAGEGDNN